jgi:cyclic pyranopterin phosphate synthase
MTRGQVDDPGAVWDYVDALRAFGVTEFTFKHTYVAYDESLFRGSEEDAWAREHRVECDPFAGEGEVIARLPWGPSVRRLKGVQVCYYSEPTPQWERHNRQCRSSNLLSDGAVYASLEDTSSLLYRLAAS